MKDTHKLIGIALALCLGTACAVPGNKALEGRAETPLTRQAYDAAKKRIEAQYRADRQICERLKGERRDVCDAQAEGRQEAARAKLEARYKGTPDAIEQAKQVTAAANYKVAKEKCDALKGRARSRCVDEAKAAREAALRQARVEKVRATGGIFGGRSNDERKAPRGAS